MADIGIELIGDTALVSSLDDAAGVLVDLAQVNRDAGADVIGAADIPVRTGALAATARVEADAIGFALVAGSESVDYAGTVHARDPFFTDALTAHEAEVVDRYADHIDTTIDQIHGA